MAAAKIFSSLGKIGIGLAVAGGVINTALYNGKLVVILGCYIVYRSMCGYYFQL